MARRTFILSIGAFAVGALVTVGISSLLVPEDAPAGTPVAGHAAAPAGSSRAVSPAANAAPLTPQALQDEIIRSRRNAIVRAVEQVSPSVAAVVIDVPERVSFFPMDPFLDPFRRDLFERFLRVPRDTRLRRVRAGTALVLTEDGQLVTNHHLIERAERVYVTLADGRTAEAEVIGSDANRDLALLRMELDGLEPVQLGDSKNLYVGEWVVAIGFPVVTRQSTEPTVTVGVVSATRRTFQPRGPRGSRVFYADMIQTDAAINPGASGGPLATAAGEVVGINTFILSEGGGSEGLGFAIPIERALRVADELRDYGRIRTITIDFDGQPVSAQIAAAVDLETPRGLIVSVIAEGGEAEASGLHPGDVILAIDDKPVDDMDDSFVALSSHFVGDSVILTVWRDEQILERSLELRDGRSGPPVPDTGRRDAAGPAPRPPDRQR